MPQSASHVHSEEPPGASWKVHQRTLASRIVNKRHEEEKTANRGPRFTPEGIRPRHPRMGGRKARGVSEAVPLQLHLPQRNGGFVVNDISPESALLPSSRGTAAHTQHAPFAQPPETCILLPPSMVRPPTIENMHRQPVSRPLPSLPVVRSLRCPPASCRIQLILQLPAAPFTPPNKQNSRHLAHQA
jgi:hypothetical protein